MHSSNKNSAKTPYEIRLDLLRLSFEIQQGTARAAAEAEASAKENDSVVITTAPTINDVIVQARVLNDFVSDTVVR